MKNEKQDRLPPVSQLARIKNTGVDVRDVFTSGKMERLGFLAALNDCCLSSRSHLCFLPLAEQLSSHDCGFNRKPDRICPKGTCGFPHFTPDHLYLFGVNKATIFGICEEPNFEWTDIKNKSGPWS